MADIDEIDKRDFPEVAIHGLVNKPGQEKRCRVHNTVSSGDHSNETVEDMAGAD
jgi:hypothetical protein